MKLTDIRSGNGRLYFRFWSMAFKALLSWSDQRIEQWADKFDYCINNENDFLYNDEPGEYVIPAYLDERYPNWRQKLEEKKLWTANTMQELSDCINLSIHPELKMGRGWDEARLRLESTAQRKAVSQACFWIR